MSVAEAPAARAVVRGSSSGARLREILFPAALLLCIGSWSTSPSTASRFSRESS
jgi:hypothetical protein